MFSLLKNRIGIPGVIAVIALVFAMAGGAWAAKGVIITKLNQIAPSVQKQLKGKTGPAGQQGPAGTNGTPGAKGDAGPKGDAGTNGTNGKSATVTEIAEGDPECQGRGGAKVAAEGSGSAEVCNGETGFSATLPEGETETGVYSAVLIDKEEAGVARVPVSFSIPLASELGAAQVKVNPEGEPIAPECENADHEGSASVSNPEAQSGFLCVYVGFGVAPNALKPDSGSFNFGAFKVGNTLIFLGGEVFETVRGTWAVTG